LMLLIDTEHEGAERSLRLGDTQNDLERAERSLRRALELAPSLSIAYSWLSSVLAQQGRNEEANVVQEQGLLVDPLNPVLSANKADWLVTLGEHERAEQILLRLTDLPNPPWMAYSRLWRLYSDTGEFDKALHWAKEYTRANKFQSPRSNAAVAGRYEHLGLTEDADYWLADAVAHTPRPESRFFFKSWQLKIRGDLAGIRAETDKLRIALGPDIDALHGIYAAQYASANILVGNFDVGIDVFETVFDFESLSIVDDMKGRWLWAFEFSHALAYAYQQVGRDDEANVLLTRLHERLNAYVIEDNMDFGPVHHLLAQNFGLRGDFDAAADALEAAIKVGWLRYIWVMNDPTWAQTIADPRIARMLDDVKVELERQRAVVEQTDAEHDFRAEYEAMRSALDD
jgi:tetratricopeptide (TPR) repeat protein